MPNITLRLSGDTITADTASIVNGNNDYTVTVETDGAWQQYRSAKLLLVRYLADGTAPQTEIELSGMTASLPALSDTCAVGLGVTAVNGDDTVTSETVSFLCEACITDGDAAEQTAAFDVYNAMTAYINGILSGTAVAAELAEQYAALAEYRACLSDSGAYSDAYRQAIAAPYRYTKLEGILTDAAGTEIRLTSDNIAADSVSISFDCTADGGVLPGGVPSAELRMTLLGITDSTTLYGAEISLEFYILLPDGWDSVPLGTFTLAGVETDTQEGLAVVAYDDMYLLDHISVDALPIERGKAYAPQEIITMCADALKADCPDDVSSWINGARKYILSDLDASVKTARDLLMHTVQTVCAFAYFDRYRRLRVIPFAVQNPQVTVTEQQRRSIAVTQQAYRLYRLTAAVEYPNADGERQVEESVHYTMWSDGVTAELAENPLFPVLDTEQALRIGAVRQMLAYITQQLDPVVFHPIDAETYGDPSIEPFEWRSFPLNGITYNAPILSLEWKYSGTMRISSSGQDAVAGVTQDQSQKAALARRINSSAQSDNFMRSVYLLMIRTNGHAAMNARPHEWLAHFTHQELSGKEN